MDPNFAGPTCDFRVRRKAFQTCPTCNTHFNSYLVVETEKISQEAFALFQPSFLWAMSELHLRVLLAKKHTANPYSPNFGENSWNGVKERKRNFHAYAKGMFS